MIASTLSDLRLSLRALHNAPGFSAAVVLMLGLGIGVHLVVGAVVDGLVVRPLPFGDRSARLYTLHSTHPTLAEDWDDSGVSWADLLDWRRSSRTLEGLEAAFGRNLSVTTDRESERVLAASVTPGLFSLLGVTPLLGRSFEQGDGAEPGFEQVVIVSHGLWRTLLGGDPAAVGRALRINGRALTVVGVMPPRFAFPDQHQLWLPYRGQGEVRRANRGLLAIGLLRDGATAEQARSELRAVAAQLAAAYPESNRDWGVHLLPLRDFFVDGQDAATLLGAVTLLLLVACANAAGLIVARGVGRQRELALRAALGASRARVLRLVGAESSLLAAAGGLAGLVFAYWGIRALLATSPEPPPYWAEPTFGLRTLAAALVVTAAAAVFSGLAPSLQLSRPFAGAALSPGTRATGGTPAQRRLQMTLVVGQIAVSLALLVGAVLLGESARALMSADVGFDRRPLLSARTYIAGDQYDPPAERGRVVAQMVARAAELPGVLAAAATGSIPSDDGGAAIRIRLPLLGAGGHDALGAQLVPVSPGFFATLALGLIDGRTFTAAEAADPATDVVVLNRRLADLLFPAAGAVGRTITLEEDGAAAQGRVVGVAPDLVYEEVGEATTQSALTVYVPIARAGWRTQALLVRATGDPGALAADLRAAVRSVDPGFAVYDLMTMDERRAFNHQGDRLLGTTFSAFALAALLLSCVGAYAIVAYRAQQRRQEVGIRVALGATRRSVVSLFVRLALRLALAGAALGLPLGLAVARLIESQLYQVSPWRPALWLLLPAAIVASVVAASYLPARRAAQLDPAAALRDS